MDPVFVHLDDVFAIHHSQIEDYGGSHGIRDLGLLVSALAQPEAGSGGQYLHHDLFEMGAAYLFHITQNHPFLDGNKRVGLETALTFLALNGIEIEAEDNALEQMVLSVAAGQANKTDIAEFLRANARPA